MTGRREPQARKRRQAEAAGTSDTIGAVTMASLDSSVEVLQRLAHRQPGLRLLLLFGSRVRGDATARSDWDLGYLAEPDFDAAEFLAQVVEILGTDRVDLVDLAHAGGQLRFRAAQDGRVVYAADSKVYARFWLDTVSFWCDAGPVLRAGYAHVLASLG